MLNAADTAFVDTLRATLPEGRVKASEPRYLEEPRRRLKGHAAAVVAPRSVDEVSVVLRLASEARVGVVPYGGGTGLVGGQIQSEGPAPILLSLEAMTAIRAVHAEEAVLVAEAGASVAAVQAAAEEAGMLFPLSYGSEGTAQIGSGLAVNSGGINVLRYGTARDLCLGVEAVLPDGQIVHGLRRLRKDNTGYDLRNLLIGSEGTLGVITAASLRLYPRPRGVGTVMMAVRDPEAALALLARSRATAGEAVSAFELISGVGPRFIVETGLDIRQPLDPIPDWAVLMELGTADADAALPLIEEIFAGALEAGEVSDGVIAQSGSQRADFWRLREGIPEANARIGSVASHDVSLPLSELPGYIDEATAAVEALGPIRVNVFGHLGDGNLHFNCYPPKGGDRADYDDIKGAITHAVHDLAVTRGGSFSAEHGVGRLKVTDLERYGDPARLDAMRKIKAALDPGGIMNPGAVLRAAD